MNAISSAEALAILKKWLRNRTMLSSSIGGAKYGVGLKLAVTVVKVEEDRLEVAEVEWGRTHPFLLGSAAFASSRTSKSLILQITFQDRSRVQLTQDLTG
jgi:hypothetical protein